MVKETYQNWIKSSMIFAHSKKTDLLSAVFCERAEILLFTRENIALKKLRRKLRLRDLSLCKISLARKMPLSGKFPDSLF